MSKSKGIWILTASESLASNLEELLDLDGYPCIVTFDAVSKVIYALNDNSPDFIILDELNNKGSYLTLLNYFLGNRDTKVIILNVDREQSEYSLAKACLALPQHICLLPDVLST